MKLKLPPKVSLIIDILRRHGFEAYAVGGCVRDSVLARTPNDWDITTAARPEEIKSIFRRTVDTGIEHGTVTVLIDDASFEVTTFRVDGTYSDGRHPDSVTFTPSLKEDLKRRDFTINAMAYNDKVGLIDLYGGMEDLQKHVIRAVGDPEARFEEDALRVMRAVRFAAQLGFAIDPVTLEAVAHHAPDLARVSAERIQTELVKLLISPNPGMFRILYETGITGVIMPEFDRMMATPQNTPYHNSSVGGHTLRTLPLVPPDKVLRLAMLLHDSGKPEARCTDDNGRDHFTGHAEASVRIARSILRRLKFDNETIRKTLQLVKWHDLRPASDPASVRLAVHEIGRELFFDYIMVERADTYAKSLYRQEENLTRIEEVNKTYIHVLGRGDPLSLKDLAIDGSDLLAAGFRGRQIGQILDGALKLVLKDPAYNTRECLMTYAAGRDEKEGAS